MDGATAECTWIVLLIESSATILCHENYSDVTMAMTMVRVALLISASRCHMAMVVCLP